ncbi:MAG: ABC transporter permease [Acidobacteriia bacterium]|nr:ABC transporter permease [Terriglobia bacterium]
MDSFHTLLQDLRFGLRALRRSPGFAVLAVMTLALGIGANTAMFSVIEQVLFARLPYRDPDRVVYVAQKQSNGGANVFSVPDFLEWRAQSDLLAHMAGVRPSGFTLGVGDHPERIQGALFSSDTFSVLGVTPALGRAFTADEDRPGSGKFVLLSDSLWKTRFDSSRDVVGTKIDLDGAPATVLGVMPPGFFVLANTEQAWAPYQLPLQQTAAQSRTIHSVWGIGRLAPGTAVTAAQAQLDSIAARLHRDDPQGDAGFGVILQGYQDALTAGIKPALLLLMACVGFVLLIACCNVANLLLARATARRLEISIRSAIGAQRARLVRQLLTESLLLAVLGGLLGLGLAFAGLKAVVSLHPASVPEVQAVTINPLALVFTAVICLLVPVLFGFAPALTASRADVSNVLREAARNSSRSMGKHRAALAIAETAIACMLLIGAGLALKSLWRVGRVDLGFNPDGLLTFQVAAPASARPQPWIFYQQVAEKVRVLPGVQEAFLARNVPLSGTDPSMPVAVDGGALQSTDGQIVTRLRVIGPGYFHGFQTPLLQGRELTEDDTAASQPVVVVSESLVQRYWPNTNPIGHRLRPNIADAPWYTVVGVAGDVRHLGLDTPIEPTAYYPYTQMPASVLAIIASYMTVVVRSRGAITGLTGSIRNAVAAVDKTVPVYQVQTVDQLISDSGSLRRFDMWLFGVFAGLALVLAAVGVYGVMAYTVSQRTREIGILMALGAQRRDVMRMVVLQGARIALAGVVIGLASALALTRIMASLLYEVSPTDLWTFSSVAALVLCLILLACFVPAMRATRIDPMIALRYE